MTRWVTFKNLGNLTVHVDALSIEDQGCNAFGFSIEKEFCKGFNISPKSEYTIKITFTP